MRTFISFIGTGKPGDGGYIKTSYTFKGGAVFEVSCFADAVRKSSFFHYDEAVFIGTATSAWSMLLEDSASEYEALYETLWNRENSPEGRIPLQTGSALEQELQKALERIWHVPVRLHIHTPELNPENEFEIYSNYVRELFESGNDLLLDVTHSFRWMPLFLVSAVELRNAFPEHHAGVDIVYGEYSPRGSFVRELTALSKGRTLADALGLFFQKFEPYPLCDLLRENRWESGGKALKKLGSNIQGNFFLPLLVDPKNFSKTGSALLQLKNALDDFAALSAPEVWLIQTEKKLRKIWIQLSVPSPWKRLRNMSVLLAERKLYAQAFMALCLAEEFLILECMGCNSIPDDYSQLKWLKEEFKKEFPGNGKHIFEIESLRNGIAHGGLSARDYGIPQAENLPSQYEKALRALESVAKNCHKS